MDTVPDRSRLLERLRFAVRARGYSRRTEATYVSWVRRYMSFHNEQHPAQLDDRAVVTFLSHLTSEHGGSAATRNQAASALRFLYCQVLRERTPVPRAAGRPHEAGRPIVLTPAEVKRVLDELSGTHRLVVSMLYGCGLRLLEALQLRFSDIDLERERIIVRGARGRNREVPLPATIAAALARQLARVRELHSRDRSHDGGWVTVPGILAQYYPRGLHALGWQYVFPAAQCQIDPLSGRHCRHHLHETSVQRAVRSAVRRAGIGKHVTCHTFRHSFATHLVQSGYDILTIGKLMGHHSVRSTRLYYGLIDPGSRTIRSPLDTL